MGFSIYTVTAEQPFLRILARAVLQGFPLGASDMPLSHWTILVPNRRSARALEHVLLQESKTKAILLPRIKPIGDIDEDLIADSLPVEGVPDGISKTDHLHAILKLLMEWAEKNPSAQLADDVLHSGAQAFSLASSLHDLVNQFETEDVELDNLKSVYDLDLAGHRQNILDLLQVVTSELPKWLAQEKLIGPGERRNKLIRLEAKRIANGQHKGPIIAAGSTGTNPATRDLLKAIAENPMGAVILPGLDCNLDEAAWSAITPEHPQYALRTMLQQWGVTRADVQNLGAPQAKRMWLMGQALRPAAVADQWSTSSKNAEPKLLESLEQVELVEAADRQQEADVIALRLRQHLAEQNGKAALITPDRDLATRVKAALQRWNVRIDDSAGEPLVHSGRAALLLLLLHTVEDNFSATSLFAALYHHECTLGLPREEHIKHARTLELAGFRGLPEASSLNDLPQRLALRRKAILTEPHAHPLLQMISEDMWAGAITLALQLVAVLKPLQTSIKRSFAEHIDSLVQALNSLAPPYEKISPADQLLLDVMQSLKDGSKWHPLLPLSKAQHSIAQALARETVRPPLDENSRLAIYGLAEARLVDVDLAILGGLTEGAWPERPETGPWLNRPMRHSLQLQQPEREIGVTAHDFVQGFCHPDVMVTWPKRLSGAPALPSRWVLRLKAILTAAGLKPECHLEKTLPRLLQRLDAPRHFAPQRVPEARPHVASRPTQFSVTRVETLVRDSYAIYARNILKLEPLAKIGEDVDARLRGSLIHAALQSWTVALSHVPASESLSLLLAKGEAAFRPYMALPEVARFWWPRFARMAEEFVAKDLELRSDVLSTKTEISGAHSFIAADVKHKLTARADRIDISHTGELRLVDYKSGQVPTVKQMKSGFAPQLTLEAYIASQHGFNTIESNKIQDVMYIGVGGGSKGVEIISLAVKDDVLKEAQKAFDNLTLLLAAFQNVTTPYIPRHNPEFEDKPSDYDHLSRKLEWQLEGSAL